MCLMRRLLIKRALTSSFAINSSVNASVLTERSDKGSPLRLQDDSRPQQEEDFPFIPSPGKGGCCQLVPGSSSLNVSLWKELEMHRAEKMLGGHPVPSPSISHLLAGLSGTASRSSDTRGKRSPCAPCWLNWEWLHTRI